MFDLFAKIFSLGSGFWKIFNFYVHVSVTQPANIHVLLDISIVFVKDSKQISLARNDVAYCI